MGKCMCVTCPMRRIAKTEHHQELVYDALTGRVTEWTTVPPPKPHTDPLEQWYDEFTEREFGRVITTADTYKREHGALRPKRYAVR
ncbi:hypothetical protein, partial [Alicyclobacillus suci]|uniref:hypothetical protein n=1 Tax=Alicyclobacillus suci TaxID=2816080 RepID=UPI001A8EF689